MKRAPTLDEIFAVMASASVGDRAARVEVSDDADADEPVTRVAFALNVLLDDLALRAEGAERELAARQGMADRLRVLADASADFSVASNDEHTLTDEIARRLGTVVRDFCAVMMIARDGASLVPVSMHGPDDALEGAREMFAEPMALASHAIARRVHETGEPFLAPKLDRVALQNDASPRAVEFGKRMGTHSMLIVPLRVRERSYGQIVLLRFRKESPPFDAHDLDLARSLADRAALAVANARTQSELRASEARYRMMFDGSPLPKWLFDSETLRFLAVNDAAVREYGYSREEFLAMTLADIRPPEDVAAMREAVQLPNRGRSTSVWRHQKKNGAIIQVELTAHSVHVDGRACRLVVARDLTERARLEEQLRQSQKMDAVGRLAGGVAHDFNNLLSVILSCGEMALADMSPNEPSRADVQEIMKAGSRAAELTRQLLTFSRQRLMQPKVLTLDTLLASMDKMLRRIIGEDIELVSVAAPSGKVRVDPGSIEQVILNLVVNARDAMPTGGKLTIEVANVMLEKAYAEEHLGAAPGPHVMLAVTDTGVGMDRTTQARIFEPFFTTKEQGKGTGLGLSTVFGFVRQCGGSIWVYSEPGKGATFKIYFPRVDAALDPLSIETGAATMRGTETVLLVEDDAQVRSVASSILTRSGYTVLETRLIEDAVAYCAEHPDPIHLLLTDVVMPRISGPELAKQLTAIRPRMRVLYMSGYTDDSVVRHGVIDDAVAYLQKPLTPEGLTRKVREVLDAP